MNVYELETGVRFHQLAHWLTHPRYALKIPKRELALPAGTWLPELPAESDGNQALYRLADGGLVALPRPLADSQAGLLENP
jgi:hypothetical protein